MLQNDLEKHVYAYFLANGAGKLSMAPRAWPRGELTMIVKDKVELDTYAFGRKATAVAENVAREFLDRVIETGGFSTVEGRLGGVMHTYQPDAYRTRLDELRQENSILTEAQGAGPQFWEAKFQELTA